MPPLSGVRPLLLGSLLLLLHEVGHVDAYLLVAKGLHRGWLWFLIQLAYYGFICLFQLGLCFFLKLSGPPSFSFPLLL